MKLFSRRKFLYDSTVGAGVLAIPYDFYGGWPTSGSRVTDIKFPAAPRERLAVASWPFRKEIVSAANEYRDNSLPGVDLRDFSAGVRERFGVTGVEPLSSHFSSTDDVYLKGFREAIEKAGVFVRNIPVDNSDSYSDPDPAGRKRATENAVKWMNVAVILGSPGIRTSMPEVKGAKPSVELASQSLREVIKHAMDKNVVVTLENDNLISEDAFFIVKVVETVNSPWLHALPDFCNSMTSGKAEFNYSAVAAMFKHAYNICHVKDSEVGDAGHVFRVDLEKTFGILRASNYRGFCSMEFEGEGDPHAGTQKLIEASLKYLA